MQDAAYGTYVFTAPEWLNRYEECLYGSRIESKIYWASYNFSKIRYRYDMTRVPLNNEIEYNLYSATPF